MPRRKSTVAGLCFWREVKHVENLWGAKNMEIAQVSLMSGQGLFTEISLKITAERREQRQGDEGHPEWLHLYHTNQGLDEILNYSTFITTLLAEQLTQPWSEENPFQWSWDQASSHRGGKPSLLKSSLESVLFATQRDRCLPPYGENPISRTGLI